MATLPDPLAAVATVFQNNVSYQSDDSSPTTQNYANNGLDVETFPYNQRKQRVCPVIIVGPLHPGQVKPANIGNTPNSRWEYHHSVECHILTQTFQSPNISGYNGMVKIWESVRQVVVQNQTAVDGSGDWMLLKVANGPYMGPETTVTPDRYDLAFILELWRSVVN
jgi:hypothetical protein